MGTVKMNRKLTASQVAELIEVVFRKGAYLKENERTVRRLAKLGRPALDALLELLKRPPKIEMDPRDFLDSVGSFLSAIARTDPDAVVDRLDDLLDQGPTWLYVYDALGNAKGRRSLDALIAGLKDESQYARDAAARALVKRKSKKAISALIEALRDRSNTVRWTIVTAMVNDQMYRRPEAAPLLQRIASNKSVLKNNPLLAEKARQLSERIERKSS